MQHVDYREWLFFLFIIIIAFLFRYVWVGSPDLISDEGDLASAIINVLEKGWLFPWQQWGGLTPPLTAWGSSFFVKFFGFSEWSVRLFSVLSGVLTVVCIYSLARLQYGVSVARNAALLSAVVPLSVFMNRHGPADSPLLFFTVLAIFFWEYGYFYKLFWPYVFGGFVAGFAMLTKYNGVIIFGLYWSTIVIFDVWKIKGGRYDVRPLFKKIFVSFFCIMVVVFLSFGWSLTNLLYFIRGILFWVINQNLKVGYLLPWHYSFSILFDGLSPLLFIFLPVAGVILLFRPSRTNILNMILCFVFFAIVISGSRHFPRHFLLGMPFAMIVIAVALEFVRKKIKWRGVVFFTLLLFVVCAGLWSFDKIKVYRDFVIWSSVSDFILDETPTNSSVFVHGGEYWSLRYYANNSRNITSNMNTISLKSSDVVIVHRINESRPFFSGSPLQTDLTFYSVNYAKQHSFDKLVEFYAFVRKYGVKLKTFSYDNKGNEIDVYQIGNIKQSISTPDITVPITDPMTTKACSIWVSDSFLKNFLSAIIPFDFQKKMTKKCTYGCVDTCGMF